MVGHRLLFGPTGDRCFVLACSCSDEPCTSACGTVPSVEVVNALAVLGLNPPCSWDDVRSAYRDQLLASHPDTGADGASNEQTEAVVAAFRALRTLTQDGLVPLPFNDSPDDGLGLMVLHARPGDVFVRLCQAADEIGHLSYADRDANLLQVTIASEDWAPSQLTAELTAEGDVTTALFSLEALGVDEAPPIADVVRKLADQLKAPAAID